MRAPSIKAFLAHFDGSKTPPADPAGLARELRDLIHGNRLTIALRRYDQAVGNHGIEYTREEDDIFSERGLVYSNAGDSYCPTLIWDRSKGTIRLCCWGDIIERNPKRFA